MFQMTCVFDEFERAMPGTSCELRRKVTKSGNPIGRPKADAATEGTIRMTLVEHDWWYAQDRC
jgi:hypothetical protein